MKTHKTTVLLTTAVFAMIPASNAFAKTKASDQPKSGGAAASSGGAGVAGKNGGKGKTPKAPPSVAPAEVQFTTPGPTAVIRPDGYAAAPETAPDQIKKAIWAANLIVNKTYCWGCGHDLKGLDNPGNLPGTDCSGAVNVATRAAGFLKTTALDSSGYAASWGEAGEGTGQFVVYANAGHAFVHIAGIRLDTSAAGVAQTSKDNGKSGRGPRWRPLLDKDGLAAYTARNPVGPEL